jgi:acetyl esterase
MNLFDQLTDDMKSCFNKDCTLVDAVIVEGLDNLSAQRVRYHSARAFWNQGGPDMQKTVEIEANNEGVPVTCRIHYPTTLPGNGPWPVVIFCHGGGWVMGDNDTHDRIMRELAHRGKFVVAGVDYRLAPEARFPLPHNDALAALRHIQKSGANMGLDVSRIALAGDSAGAHMSLYCGLESRFALPSIKAMALIYGCYGLEAFYLTSLLGDGLDMSNSGFDLLDRDFSGMPPSIVVGSKLDPLRDDSSALVAVMQRAGVECRLQEFGGVLHGYLHYSKMLEEARQTLDLCAGFLTEKLNAGH